MSPAVFVLEWLTRAVCGSIEDFVVESLVVVPQTYKVRKETEVNPVIVVVYSEIFVVGLKF